MRKKPLIVTLIIVCVLALAAGLLLWRPFRVSTGIYLAAESPVIMFDNGSMEPVVMLGRTGDDMFANLQTGDRILILHDGTMMLTYPAQMNVFFCIRLKKGDVSDFPEETIESLKEMGWL